MRKTHDAERKKARQRRAAHAARKGISYELRSGGATRNWRMRTNGLVQRRAADRVLASFFGLGQAMREEQWKQKRAKPTRHR